MCAILILAIGKGSVSEKLVLIRNCTGKLEGVLIPLRVGLWYIGTSVSLYLFYLHLVV